jgi:hypothetical protein
VMLQGRQRKPRPTGPRRNQDSFHRRSPTA